MILDAFWIHLAQIRVLWKNQYHDERINILVLDDDYDIVKISLDITAIHLFASIMIVVWRAL